MATPLKSNGSSLPHRTPVRQRLSGQSSVDASDSLRTFRDLTDGLSNRLEMPSLEPMRAGMVNNPISLMRRFLVAMREAGLPKERAMRVAVWLQAEIDARWPLEPTPMPELERRAMDRENADNLAELAYHNGKCRETLRVRRDELAREIAADQLLLAKIDRELEEQR